MVVNLDAEAFQAVTVSIRAGLTVVVGNDHTAHIQAHLLEFATQAEHIFVVGNAEVATHLVLLNVFGTDHKQDFRTIAQLHQHLQFSVRLESGQHTTGVIVIKQLTSKFKVKLVAELGYALLNVFGLYLEIFLVIKTMFHTECKFNSSF